LDNQKLSKSEAISLMNAMGGAGAPFLFIIDFEMKAIRIYPLDEQLPGTISYSFQNRNNSSTVVKDNYSFAFRMFPITFRLYNLAFMEVQKQIYAGNTFLTNLTFPTLVETNLTLREIFSGSTAKYKLLLEDEFVCFSPETFITIVDGVISTFPMKGTIKSTGPDSERELLADTKEIAEHNTIVDLLRNDLSMVASHVKVNRFRYVEKIRTHEGDLLQVSSEITGRLPEDYPGRLGEIIFTLLPAGSVSGAPKQKTMAIIRDVEKANRGYYTGVWGVFDGINLDSAVMIRFIENYNGVMRFRSGGGITFLSDARTEYEELKAKVYVPII